MSMMILIPMPHVPFGPVQTPELLADADYLDAAARNIDRGYEVGGYHLTSTVVKLLRDTAIALRHAYESESRTVYQNEDGSWPKRPDTAEAVRWVPRVPASELATFPGDPKESDRLQLAPGRPPRQQYPNE